MNTQCGAQTLRRKVQMPSIADALGELKDKTMTRKEQIKEYLLTIGNGEMNIPFDAGFECGVEWADAHPHWISVDDELPKEDGRYLFYHTILGVQSSYYYNDLTLDKAVTHWMPLTAPPKKGDQCND